MPTLNDAKCLLEENVSDEKIRLHCREVSVIMQAVAKELGEDVEKWAIVGLVHDIDFSDDCDITKHGTTSAQILLSHGYAPEIIHAVQSHNEEHTGIKRETKLDIALSAADNVSGLIYAYALMKGGIVTGMEVSGLKKKMKDKRFAAAVRRDLIQDIEKVMPLDKFLDVAIKAIAEIKDEISLK